LTEDFHEAKVGQVANEGAARVREGQGITPEEPLEAHDRNGHHGQPNQGQGGLAPGETAVEEADTGDHEQHEC